MIFLALAIFIALANAELFLDSTENDFGNGTFFRTFYNPSSYIQLNISDGFSVGNFTSRIFDAGSEVYWENISWMTEVCYGCELPDNSLNESSNYLSPADMSNNVLLLHLNEPSGTIFDSSGNGNNGTQSGGVTYGADGKFNTSLQFDGSNDYVDFGNQADFNDFGDSITLEAWVFPTNYAVSGQDFPTVIDKDYANQFSMYFDRNGGSQDAFLVVDMWTNGARNTIDTLSTFPRNKWYHLAFTYDGSTASIYVNNTIFAQESVSGNINNVNKALLVGAGWEGSSVTYPFEGIIDEVAVYNRSLNAQEIREHYLRGISKMNLSVRSCDDSGCAGEEFINISGESPQNLSVLNNTYFQYRIELLTEDVGLSPQFYNFSAEYLEGDTTLPIFSSLSENPLNGTSYSPNQNYEFNATITDNIGVDTAGIEFNGTNYSVTDFGEGIYGFSIANLPAGTYTYYWWASDTSGNFNVSETKGYIITKASPDLTFTLNSSEENITFVYSGQVNASAFSQTSNVEIQRDGENATSENNIFVTLPAGEYNYTASSLENQNYSGLSITRFLNISKAESEANTFLNNSRNNISIDAGTQIYLNGTLALGMGDIELHLGETLINSGESPLSNLTNFTSEGTFNVSTIYSGNENYTESTETFFVNVTPADTSAPFLEISYPLAQNYTTNVSELNYTVADENLQSCWYSTDLGITNNSITCGNNVSGLISNEGSNTWKVYANDTTGNLNTSSVTFFKDTLNPSISMIYPLGQNYTIDVTDLNYTVSDANLQSCWYSTDSGVTNVSVTCGVNVSGAISNEGSNTWTVWANDTFGNLNFSSVTFFKDTIIPDLEIAYPLSQNYTVNVSELNYTVSDANLQSCWYSLDGGLSNSSVACGNNVSELISNEGSNTWKVYANDTTGNLNTSSVTFFKDTIKPLIEIVSPLNQNYSNSTILLDISSDGENVWYEWNGTNKTYTFPVYINFSEGLIILTAYANDSLGNFNLTSVNFSVSTADTSPPTWVTEPNNQTINEGESFSYSIEATDDIEIGVYFIDDTANFLINQSGYISNISSLSATDYSLNISVNDTSGNILSKQITISVNASSGNSAPTINSNGTFVNGIPKIPEIKDNFFIQANISDAENDTIVFVNFTITAPNGTVIGDNIIGAESIADGYSIWNSTNYVVDDYGIWNWSFILSDGSDTLVQNGSFEVYSGLFIFPTSYIESPNNISIPLLWNLSLYHSSPEDYAINFSHYINQTYFNLTFETQEITISRNTYNSSSLFNNLVTIEIHSGIPPNISYSGHINVTNKENGEIFTIPITIGINPPSGNSDAFSSAGVRCVGDSCDVSIAMENDETNYAIWKLKNVGNYSLSECNPNMTGFDYSGFGSFSHNNFSLDVSQELDLQFTIANPPVNSYYGKLDVVCNATQLGFTTSLGAETGNVPSFSMIVRMDSGAGESPGGNPDSGGGGGGGGSTIPNTKQQDLLFSNETLEIEPINVIISLGETKSLKFDVKNKKPLSVNKCSLVAEEGYSPYIESNQITNIAGGEVVDFSFILKALDEKVKNIRLSIECLEESSEVPTNIILLKSDLDISLEEISPLSKDEFYLKYSVVSQSDYKGILKFRILTDGNVVSEILREIDLTAGEIYIGEIVLDLKNAKKGMIKINVLDEREVILLDEDVFYGGGIGTGFSIFGLGPSAFYMGLIFIVFLAILFFLTRRIIKLKYGSTKALKHVRRGKVIKFSRKR